MLNERFCVVNGYKIRYLDVGTSKNSIVLIHGLGASLERWLPIIPHLKNNYRLVIPDVIGFGFSDKPDAVYTIEFFVKFLSDFLEKLEIKKINLIGSSLGGQIAVEYTMTHDHVVDKLVLVAPSGVIEYSTPAFNAYIAAALYPNEQNTRKAFQLISNGKTDDETIRQFVERMNLPNAKSAFMSALISNRDKRISCEDMIKIRKPTLIIWGSDDTVIPPENSKIFFSCIPNCRYVEMAGCGHTPFVEKPEKFSNLICDFMRCDS